MDHSEVKHLPKVDHTPAELTKLSQAMRLGATLSPQIRYRFTDPDGGTCAICAAAVALGRNAHTTWKGWEEMCAWLGKQTGTPVRVVSEASARHFQSKDSREQIADWLESLGY